MTLCVFCIILGEMDIYLFRDLERLEQTGNFSQAAASLNMSQPAFSRRIKTLEAWVGRQLVNRSRQPVQLTPAGLQMLEAGTQALTRIEYERSQILDAYSLPDKYVVSFATQHSIGWRFYPAWLQGLEDAFGPILSRLRADNLPDCMQDLQNGDVDFVIAYQSPEALESGSVSSLIIGQDRLIPVCKPDQDGHPIFDFTARGVDLPFLRFGDSAPMSFLLEPLLTAKNLKPRLKTVYENSMAGALRIRARSGDGVAWLPHSLVASDIQSGLLVQAGEPGWDVPMEIRLFQNTQYASHITRAIWSFLESRQSICLADTP